MPKRWSAVRYDMMISDHTMIRVGSCKIKIWCASAVHTRFIRTVPSRTFYPVLLLLYPCSVRGSKACNRKTRQIFNNKWRQRLRMQRASVLGPLTISIAPSKDRRNTMVPYHSLATLTSMNPSSVASSREESGGDWDGPLIVCCFSFTSVDFAHSGRAKQTPRP